ASEHTVRGYGFPLDAMFGKSNFPKDARALGAALVQAASQSMPADSLVAVDLVALRDELMPALDRLGQGLERAARLGHRQAIKDALDETQAPAGGLLASGGKKVDLAHFLERLNRNPALSATVPELQAAQRALDKTILSMLGKGSISFASSPGDDAPPGWRNFLSRL
ncbi:MAG: hypothetical protein AB1758_08995, partial [Candidatus Eremiobacterota bacterium]